jgi:hypothetical protein
MATDRRCRPPIDTRRGRGVALVKWGLLLALSCVLACARGCSSNRGEPTVVAPQFRPANEEIAEAVFQGGLKEGWQDRGFCPRAAQGPGPAELHFANLGGWMLAKPGLKPDGYGALIFREQPPKGEAEFLEVRLDASTTVTFPRVKLRADHRVARADGWSDVRVPMTELNPDNLPFDRLIFRAFRATDDRVTLIDGVAFTRTDAAESQARLDPANYAKDAKRVVMRIDCTAKPLKISPLIYGIAYYPGTDSSPAQWGLGATARRFGGNSSSRYNWELGVWNLDADWFFENKPAPKPWEQFFDDNRAHDVASVITVPMLGWVAKDGTSYSFPVSVFGAQGRVDPYNNDAGDGTTPSGTKLTARAPTNTSVPAPPEWAKRWVEAIRARDAKTGKRSVVQYILDNEPSIWHQTHRDVRTEPLGYDELLERTIQYGTAIREADPDAVIAGPAEWGWTAYMYSGKDGVSGYTLRLDRRAHDDKPLVEWYLQKLREHEQKSGVRVLDVLDLHFYPQAEGVYGGGNGNSDPAAAALRLRLTRGLWDPRYVDESWIKEPIRLLPRMKEWVEKYYPGRGISIGEWNFGGENHISGALATAEALGRFAEFGVHSAFYWTHPPDGSPAIQAFVAYRNFDGKGGRFLDWYVPSTGAEHVSLFASRDEAGTHLVAVAINMSADEPFIAKLDLGTCGPVASRTAYTFMRAAPGFVAAPGSEAHSAEPSAPEQVLPPYSITVVDVHLSQPVPGRVK